MAASEMESQPKISRRRMQARARIALVVLVSSAVLVCGGRPRNLSVTARAAATESPRIRYDVAAYEEQSGRRELLSETTIEGPAGTDFEIKLQSARFQMHANFLNDLVAPTGLKVRADLTTRKLYGQSERGLPLYEEDAQKQALQVGFDEKLMLLPFGRTERNTAAQLKIEITPSLSGQSAWLPSGKKRPLEINILKSGPGNSITVAASKSPHTFAVEAALFEDGREIARGFSDNCFIQEPHEIPLQPNGLANAEAVANPLLVTLSVEQYLRNRPADDVAVSFNLDRLTGGAEKSREAVASQWAGIGTVDSFMSYDISDHYLKASGRRYELRLSVKPAAGEDAD
jgi:hypothetical protein